MIRSLQPSDARGTTAVMSQDTEAARKLAVLSDDYLDLGLSTKSLYIETFSAINGTSNRHRTSAAWANDPSFAY
jgi:hypothetical protein